MADMDFTNAPTNLDMNAIQSIIKQYGGLAKTCRFVVQFKTPPALLSLGYGGLVTDLTYLCEATEFPGRQFLNAEYRTYGPTYKIPFMSEYGDIAMNILCRTDFYERQMFDDWLEIINPGNTWDFNYRNQYAVPLSLFQLSEGENHAAKYAFSLLDCFPIAVAAQPATWADDNIQRLNVTFTYTKWRRPGRDPEPEPYNLIEGASIIPHRR